MQIPISTHSPRVGRTTFDRERMDGDDNFNSLAPCGANRACMETNRSGYGFQLTRPVWGEPVDHRRCGLMLQISTHSPRVGRTCIIRFAKPHKRISTHSPRVGRTQQHKLQSQKKDNFNSLAPCGANPSYLPEVQKPQHFNSLAPCGANPLDSIYDFALSNISTHSPRVGRTIFVHLWFFDHCYFNSLAPCGANLRSTRILGFRREFQLTRPVWGEPAGWYVVFLRTSFQLTRPVWGEPRVCHTHELPA